MIRRKLYILAGCIVLCNNVHAQTDTMFAADSNPVITYKYTADPAAMVYKDKVYLYTGYDVAPAKQNRYEMHEWLCFSSTDMVNWTEHPSPVNVKDFAWAKDDAWASHVIERNGKFYWYVAITHATISWDDIDPTVLLMITGRLIYSGATQYCTM